MSKKRQNRNTKKFRKAAGSKRSRAKYVVGGVSSREKETRAANLRKKSLPTSANSGQTVSVPTQSEPVKLNNPRMSQEQIDQLVQRSREKQEAKLGNQPASINNGVAAVQAPRPGQKPLAPANSTGNEFGSIRNNIPAPTRTPNTSTQAVVKVSEPIKPSWVTDLPTRDDLVNVENPVSPLKENPTAVNVPSPNWPSNPQSDTNVTVPTNLNFNGFNINTAIDNITPKNDAISPGEAPVDLDLERPPTPQIPSIQPEDVMVGPKSTTMQMDAVSPAQAATAEATRAAAQQVSQTATAQQPQTTDAATMQAATAQGISPMQAAQGQVSPEALAQVQEGTITQPAVAAERDVAAEQAAMAQAATLEPSEGAMVGEVTGEVAQVAEAPQAIAAQREAFLGEAATMGRAAQIRLPPKTKASVDRVTLSADNIEDAVDSESLDAQQILTELPEEALVTTQLDNLLKGLESNEVPAWARPALDSVNQVLAQRGLTASTVGRDAMFNAIIQSAMPLAQSNAQALQARAAQNLSISADFLARNAEFKQQMELANLSNEQQMRLANLSALNAASSENLNAQQQTELANLQATMETNLLQGRIAAEMNVAQLNVNQQRAVQNANTVANMDMARFNAQQQVQLANSQFMQTMTVKSFDADQQAIMQNATALASMDLANLDAQTKLAAQNAQAFLQMDMTNLSNEQQAVVLNQQQAQQTMLSNQAAQNAARQFNAANEQQAQQFNASLATQISQFNASQTNAMAQFNTSEKNRIEAQNAQNATQVALANAEIETNINQFNAQLEQQREQFNTANAQAIEQADVAWRRQVNTINTAARNAANQQNVMNLFNLTMAEQQQLWQQLRDEAAYIRQSYENEETRKTQLYATAIGNESAASKESSTSITTLVNTINGFYND